MTQLDNTAIRISKYHFVDRIPHWQWYIVRGDGDNAEYWTGKTWQNAGPKLFETEDAAIKAMGELSDG